MTCELLIGDRESTKSFRVLRALEASCPVPLTVTTTYRGDSDLLVLWGVGGDGKHEARDAQVASGRHCAMWDMGYFQDGTDHFFRVSLDHQHPQAWLDRTEPDPSRWDALGLKLEEIGKEKGHILVIGMGHKSHRFLGTSGWEQRKVAEMKQRFPGKEVRLRLKPHKQSRVIPIKQAMQGASLIACRHSNVGVLGHLWGVPVETEDGASAWMQGKQWTRDNRLDFLRRLAWWQWKCAEFPQAWEFLLNMTARSKCD